MRFLCGLITMTATLGWAPSVAAAASLPRLSYAGDARCPSRDDFAQQLLSRSQTIEALTQSQIRVTVVATEDGYLGRLDLVDPQGNRAEREFSGPTCSEITQAIALVAAVIIDGSTSADTADTGTNPAPPAIPATTKRDSPSLESVTNSADSQRTGVTPGKPNSPVAARTRPLNPFSLGAIAGLHTAIAPEATPTFGLSIGYRPNGIWGSPKLRLGAVVAKSRATTVTFDPTSIGEAEFLWLATRALACPITLAGKAMQWGACSLLEIGVFRGSGSSAKGQESSTGWWFAPGVGLDWSVQFDRIALSLTGGVVRPLVREHFKFQPNWEVFRAPNLGLLAEVGVAWTF